MSTGLFLVRRLSTCTTRRISLSRPMTGSSLPSRATAVRSTPYFSSAWYVSSASWLVTRELPRTEANAACSASGVAPAVVSTCRAGESTVAMPTTRCSLDTNSSPSWAARSWARCSTSWEARDSAGFADAGAAGRREAAELVLQLLGDDLRVDAGGAEQRHRGAARLGQQRVEQVGGLHGRVARRGGSLDGRGQRLLAAGGEGRKVHAGLLAERNGHLSINAARVESIPLNSG